MSEKAWRPQPIVLVVLDGIALNPNERGNAVLQAEPLILKTLAASYPHTTLFAHGVHVGLPAGQVGGSEVGHLCMGAGRIVEQDLTRINQAIKQDQLCELEGLKEMARVIRSKAKTALHLIGMPSKGGVHSHLEHLKALILTALGLDIRNILIHVITDGRSSTPTASLKEVGQLKKFISRECMQANPMARVRIASLIGRHYAMDRDTRWDRTKKAYDLYTLGEGEPFSDPITALNTSHSRGETDEFLSPITIRYRNDPTAVIEDGDGVLFFNFRSDRMRQLVQAACLNTEQFSDFERRRIPKPCLISTLTEYQKNLPVRVLFPRINIQGHLGQVLSQAGMQQLRIAETEKYPHVTYFFNGGEEAAWPGEERVLVPSPRDVERYNEKPEMSAYEVTYELVRRLQNDPLDFVLVNYANGDTVAHTGDFEATKKAVDTVDSCLGKVIEAVTSKGGAAIVTGDHGNSDQMIDYDSGKPRKAHTKHPVPCIVVGEAFSQYSLRIGGSLCDIAPTLLDMMGIEQPEQMSGKTLLIRE